MFPSKVKFSKRKLEYGTEGVIHWNVYFGIFSKTNIEINIPIESSFNPHYLKKKKNQTLEIFCPRLNTHYQPNPTARSPFWSTDSFHSSLSLHMYNPTARSPLFAAASCFGLLTRSIQTPLSLSTYTIVFEWVEFFHFPQSHHLDLQKSSANTDRPIQFCN